ncbi:LysR substrate-binding domain-containing protein [Roseibium aggregatum]|uniref:LysR family transcriptional regulator n=1 Tax=Roseibium aggregatum TaxID=187304 RepID=A0A926S688_9HYPH|nr:LysR substrate-binding domain-containing protein [Roseibium aggregatum]MBD1546232.1 LysR family transcriptional regulator [Roseibium aggregatum]
MKLAYLNALRALEATLRTGTFSRAAAELGVTTAAVGQQIRNLEAYLGKTLFLRTPTGVVATEDALRIKARLTTGFSVIGEVLAEMSDMGTARRVAITLPESFAENWFTSRLSEFYRLNSEVDLRLNAANRRIDLSSEGFDFALRYSPPPDDGFEAIDLFGDHVLPVCTPGFADKYGLRNRSNDLRGVRLVHLDNRTPDPEWANWNDWCRAFGYDTDDTVDVMRFSRISSGLNAAIAGQGLVLCGVIEAYDAIMAGTLEMPFGPARSVPAGYRYRLLWVRGRPLSPMQVRFRSWVQDLAEKFRRDVADLGCFV